MGWLAHYQSKLEKIKKQLVLSLAELEYELDISEYNNSKNVIRAAKKILKPWFLKWKN